uniref:NADH-ubiquinone oxidoreductase chain 4 n=1 Tax=Sindiplozoon sp. DZ-2018 TaxID=2340795 RepID=A0A386PW51_9PLAT|nr:NADH dehydrogenase subunit 4 [Sindiplozoon sp. DZ-2018]
MLYLFVNSGWSYFYFIGGLSIIWCFVFVNVGSIFCGLYFLGFYFDFLFFYFFLLVFVIMLFIWFGFGGDGSYNVVLLMLSCFFSLCSFCVFNPVWFWACYELAILFVFVLLYFDSPYSDRYLAGWYLLLYFVFCGIPLLILFFYFSLNQSCFNFFFWSFSDFDGLLILVFLLFCSKIPLPPFHSWLPVVHGEASSLTSICLSGYVMKLGLLGVVRFCESLLGGYFLYIYISFSLFFSCAVLIACSEEVDYKRWIAGLSVAHIVVCMSCLLNFSVVWGVKESLLFGVGHGFSAAYFFLLVYYFELLGGTRHVSDTSSLLGVGWVNLWLTLFGFFFVCSMPPTVNFFVEVWLIGLHCVLGNFGFVCCLLVYLFFSAICPLFLLGTAYCRRLGGSDGGVVYSVVYGFLIFSFMFILLLL